MRMCSIASGSSGNCIYIGDEDTHVLVDAGISAKRIEEGLKRLGLSGRDISGILVTHEHADHILSLGVLARRYGIPLFMTGGTADWIQRQKAIGKVDGGLFQEIVPDVPFEVGTLKAEAFDISHDAAQPVGYRLWAGEKSVAVVTDTGKYNEYIVSHLQGLDGILMESNHDLNMLLYGRYPYLLKQRIMGDWGHLSNEACGHLLERLIHDDLRFVFLGHLSQDNNLEDLALLTVQNLLTEGTTPYKASDFDIRVASRTEQSQVMEF